MARGPSEVAFSPDASCVAVSSDSSGERLNICDTATGKLLWRAGDGIGAIVRSVHFAANGKILAVASYQQEIALWDLQTGKFLRSLEGSHDCATRAISVDGRW